MRTIRLIIFVLPWILLVGLLIWIGFIYESNEPVSEKVISTSVLNKIEAIGRLELVRYNFKEITEVEELSKKYLNFFQFGPDSKIALISEGEAIGCIDLTKISKTDVEVGADSVWINLPEPELCSFKLNLDKTKIYSLKTNPLKDEKAFIQKAYKNAEMEIRESALKSGILEQTRKNGENILKPLFEDLTGKVVLFTYKPQQVRIIPN